VAKKIKSGNFWKNRVILCNTIKIYYSRVLLVKSDHLRFYRQEVDGFTFFRFSIIVYGEWPVTIATNVTWLLKKLLSCDYFDSFQGGIVIFH